MSALEDSQQDNGVYNARARGDYLRWTAADDF